MSAGYSSLAGFGRPPTTQLEIMVAETQTLEDLFRKQLLLALQTGRYYFIAFDRLSPFTVPLVLIKPDQFRFGSDEMLLGDGIKVTGVRVKANRSASVAQNDPPGPKPGQQSAKDRICEAALSILNDPAKRPPHRLQLEDGPGYKLNSVEKMIRGTVPRGFSVAIPYFRRFCGQRADNSSVEENFSRKDQIFEGLGCHAGPKASPHPHSSRSE